MRYLKIIRIMGFLYLALSVITAFSQERYLFEEKGSIAPFEGALFRAVCYPKSRTLAVTSTDKTIKLLDAASFAVRSVLPPGQTKVSTLAFSTDGRWLFSGEMNGKITVWDVRSGMLLKSFTAHKNSVLFLTPSKDNSAIISYGADKKFIYSDFNQGEQTKELDLNEDDATVFAESPVVPYLFVGTLKNALLTFALPDLNSTAPIQTGAKVSTIAFSSDGNTIITGLADGYVRFWEGHSFSPRGELSTGNGRILSTAVDDAGKYVAVVCTDSSLRVYLRDGLKPIKTFLTPGVGYVFASFIGTDILIAGDTKGNLKQWKIEVVPIDNDPPSIVFVKPESSGRKGVPRIFGNEYEVQGGVYDNREVKSVTINGIQAILTDPIPVDSVRSLSGMVAKTFKAKVRLDSLGINRIEAIALDWTGNKAQQATSIRRISADQVIEIIKPENNFETEEVTVKLEFRVWIELSKLGLDVNMMSIIPFELRPKKEVGTIMTEEVPIVAGYNQIQLKILSKEGKEFTKTIGVNRKISAPAPATAAKTGKRDRAMGPQRWAVVVGVSQYKSPAITPLKYADKDAEAFANFLMRPEGGGIGKDNMKLLLNKDATLPNLKEALINFLKQAIDIDLVIIYFAGHGLPEPDRPQNLYLLTYDSDPSALGTTAFPMWQIQDVLSRYVSSKKVVVFSDACHSGGITTSYATRGMEAENNPINQFLVDLAKSKDGTIVFTASAAGEVSQELPEFSHGIFTYYLLEGLRGEADLNNDLTITISELMQYVEEQVKRKTKGAQTPTRSQTLYDKELPIAIVPK